MSALGALLATMVLPASMAAGNPPANCKPITHSGVSGCELLPDRTCPGNYHVQAVGPINPQMKAPRRLLCVPDKPDTKKPPAKDPFKPKASGRSSS